MIHTHTQSNTPQTYKRRSSTRTQMDPEIITLEEAKSEKTNIV